MSPSSHEEEKDMMCRGLAFLLFYVTLSAGSLLSPHAAWAESLVESSVETRTVLAFRVGENALQRWVSEPLRITSIPSGPFKDANLFVIFMDKLVKLDAEGKPSEGGNDRAVVFAAVAKRPQDEKPNVYVIRILTANPKALPGAYKNSVLASVRREQALKMVNLEPGTEEQQWDVRDSAGGAIEFRLRCLRGLPTPGKVEQNVYSAVEPDFFRIYRVDQGMDVVRSLSAGIDRVQSYEFRTTAAGLHELFDGNAQLVSIAILPWYLRQIFLP
jgi:hypothetical protein